MLVSCVTRMLTTLLCSQSAICITQSRWAICYLHHAVTLSNLLFASRSHVEQSALCITHSWLGFSSRDVIRRFVTNNPNLLMNQAYSHGRTNIGHKCISPRVPAFSAQNHLFMPKIHIFPPFFAPSFLPKNTPFLPKSTCFSPFFFSLLSWFAYYLRSLSHSSCESDWVQWWTGVESPSTPPQVRCCALSKVARVFMKCLNSTYISIHAWVIILSQLLHLIVFCKCSCLYGMFYYLNQIHAARNRMEAGAYQPPALRSVVIRCLPSCVIQDLRLLQIDNIVKIWKRNKKVKIETAIMWTLILYATAHLFGMKQLIYLVCDSSFIWYETARFAANIGFFQQQSGCFCDLHIVYNFDFVFWKCTNFQWYLCVSHYFNKFSL